MKRLVVALVVAPAVVLAVFFLAARWLLSSRFGPLPEMLVVLGVPLAYFSLLLFGVPLLVVARRKRWLSWSSFLLGGGLVALPLAGATALSKPGGTVHALNGGAVPAACVASGLLIGLLVWVFGVQSSET